MLAFFNIVAASKPGGQEIVLTIVGGTMLTLALTRPRLRWMERLTEASPGGRLWAERGLTVFAFCIGGYAWATLFLTLHGQLEPHPAALIRVAAYVLIGYAGLTHFEPFVNGRTKSVAAAAFAYVGWAMLAAGVGAAAAVDIRVSSLSASRGIMLVSSAGAVVCFLAWWMFPKFESVVDHVFDGLADSLGLQAPVASPEPSETERQTSRSARIIAISITVPILLRLIRDRMRSSTVGEGQ
ncbi:MAG TPA: hypothetical protein VK272_10370 [Solirubrobacteraceae bacterium]|nr:hypothetical protein [Solirubrobacteraceae bacterium]